MQRIRKNLQTISQHGMTLLEVLIALVIFAALFLGVGLVTASALRRPTVEIAR